MFGAFDEHVANGIFMQIFKRSRDLRSSQPQPVSLQGNKKERMVSYKNAKFPERQLLFLIFIQGSFEFPLIHLHQFLSSVLTQIHHC